MESDCKVHNLVSLLSDSNSVLILAAEFYEEFLAILSWVGLYEIEVIEGEFFPFEADFGIGFVIDLSFHRFDQVESWLVGFNLHLGWRTLKLTMRSTRLVITISLCISCSSRNQNCSTSGNAHSCPNYFPLIHSLIINAIKNIRINRRIHINRLSCLQFYLTLRRLYQIYLMKLIILLALVLTVSYCENWAVLVAGSHTWSNYRHQADVYHAYQVLIKGGYDANRIITLAYDDIAHHLTNPFKGKVFNKPTYKEPGVDVYAGIKIDYDKAHVTPEVFQAVLQGNKAFVKGKGTERVLESTSNDNVFIFFSDHGAPGLIAFPSKYLYADHLLQSFAKMNGKYKKLVFYLQACESGSMFVNLPKDNGIYALSAANPSESSWGTYCSPDDVVGGKHIGSCLGDLFSVNFVEDTEKGNYEETLQEQFEVIQKLTDKSHVLQWGDLSYKTNKIGQFLRGTKASVSTNLRTIMPIVKVGRKAASKSSTMDSRTIRLQSLSALYSRDHSAQTFRQMMEEMKSMQRYDEVFSAFAHTLSLSGSYNPTQINFQCLRQSIDSFEAAFGKFTDYGLGYIKYLAQACEKHSSMKIREHLKC